MPSTDLASRCGPIELLVLDVDGVLTDGTIRLDEGGVESKTFHVRDGAGIALWHQAGKRTALLSGRRAASVERRAEELSIGTVLQGVADKGPALRSVLSGLGLEPRQAAYVGDDLPDLAPMRLAGLSACPADAAKEVREAADLITSARGGLGTVREVIETLLKAQGRWDELVARVSGSF
jgi:3-deoxy-D-manno-octulosonate 8-phosphate phosphatase (KDO 8-P phosphatase)